MAGQDNDDVKTMLRDAVAAVHAGSVGGTQATARMAEQAADPALKALLEQGSTSAEGWQQRLAAAGEALGGSAAGSEGNPILDAIQHVGDRIVGKTRDASARDLAIIASSQLALHYYVAAFGTMAAYARMLGMGVVAESLHACLVEAKQGDERFSEIARK